MPRYHEKDEDEVVVLPSTLHQPPPLTSPTSLDEKMDEKTYEHAEIVPVGDDMAHYVDAVRRGEELTPEMRNKVRAYYGQKAEADGIAPSADVEVIIDRILEMSDEDAIDILARAIDFHREDNNFP